MKTPFFTADCHFNHIPIIQYANRPFKNVNDMNEELIKRWNEVVPPGSLVYVIGDFIWGKERGYRTEGTREIIDRLNGQIFLIEGSHDKPSIELIKEGYRKFVLKTTPQLRIKINKQDITLNHYCMRVWPKSHYDSWHLFGHSHNRLKPEGKSLDVGVDGHNYYPWTWNEIVEYMKTRPHNFNYINTFSGRGL